MYKLFFADVTPYYDKKKFDQGYKSVCEYRKKKIDKCKVESDKIRSLVAGLLFEEACKEYGLEELLDKIAENEHGKPFFNCEDRDFPGERRMYFNISHSEDCVMVGIADSEIGVDIQYMKPLKNDIASKCFTEKEQDLYYSASDDEYLKVFFKIWCLKESYVKYTGNGISEGLNTFSVLDHFKDSGIWQDEYVYSVTVEDYKANQVAANVETAKPKTRTELAIEESKDEAKLANTPKPQDIAAKTASEEEASKDKGVLPLSNSEKATPKPVEKKDTDHVIDANTPVPKVFDKAKDKKISVIKPVQPQKVTFVIRSKDLIAKEISGFKNRRFRKKTKILRMK